MKTAAGFAALVLVAGLVLACAAPPVPAPAPATEKPVAARPAQPTPTLTREQQLIEGAKKEGEVNIWFNTFPDAEPFLKPFRERYPFLKVKLWDAQAPPILAKMAEESKAGRRSVDILHLAGEIEDARAMGYLAEYEFPNTAGWPFQPQHKYFRLLGGGGYVIAYNTDLVPPAEVPKTWDDVKSSKWAGKTFVSSSSRRTPLDWAYLWRGNTQFNWEKSFGFWTDVVRTTRPRVVSGYTGPYERLAAGEVQILASAPSSSLFRLQAKGAPLGIAPLGESPGNSLSVGLVKDSPNPNAARLFLDWLTSEEGMTFYANAGQFNIVHPQARAKSVPNAKFASLGLSWQPVPIALLTQENLQKSADFWDKLIGIRG